MATSNNINQHFHSSYTVLLITVSILPLGADNLTQLIQSSVQVTVHLSLARPYLDG